MRGLTPILIFPRLMGEERLSYGLLHPISYFPLLLNAASTFSAVIGKS
jgi:hypothetical protein